MITIFRIFQLFGLMFIVSPLFHGNVIFDRKDVSIFFGLFMVIGFGFIIKHIKLDNRNEQPGNH